MPYVDIVLGNNDKFNIIESLNVCKSEVTDIFKVNDFNNQTIHNYSKTRGYLKIQDGCNNYCSYCTIPLARGKSRSNDIKNIIEQINIYSQIGIKEVVLTGIHIGQWGEDFSPSKQLYHLLSEIENTKILRYRLGSLNPLELNDELLQFLSKSDKFCQHFHLSLQSLTDSTLKSMNRHYTAKDCLILMEKINNIFSLPFIGSDIIVGFPGETEEDFETTLNNAKSSKLSNIHVFPYSLRSNTKAANLPNHISSAEKQRRAALLQSVAKDKYSSFIEQNIGTTAQVLIEKRPDKKTGLLKGVTKNYLNVYIDSTDTSLHNTIANVKILNKEKADSRLICKLV
ncbi:MAG: MiaB/RimO family radical SAM methylthiotransferase [Candidatus Gastranaerophilaceae bacterium]